MQCSSLRATRCGWLVMGACFAALWFAPLRAGRCLAEAAPGIVLLETFDVPVILEHTKYFLVAMQRLGYPREQIRVLKAQGDRQRAEKLLSDEMRRNKPALIVANATLAAQAAYGLARPLGIPTVFFVVSDPVGAGLVAELDVPAGLPISGVVHSVPRDTKVEMVMRILRPVRPRGRTMRFGYVHSSYPSAVGDLRMLKEAARKRGDLEFVSHQIAYDEKHFDIAQTMAQLVQGIEQLEPLVDYWWISQDPVAEQEEFVRTIVNHSKHPVICGTNASNTRSGALVHIAADTQTGARETAAMADAVLKGTWVGSIPVHSPGKIDFGVNLTTAVKAGIPIPSDLLELAGAQVFR